jgi:hypothetical protein
VPSVHSQQRSKNKNLKLCEQQKLAAGKIVQEKLERLCLDCWDQLNSNTASSLAFSMGGMIKPDQQVEHLQ